MKYLILCTSCEKIKYSNSPFKESCILSARIGAIQRVEILQGEIVYLHVFGTLYAKTTGIFRTCPTSKKEVFEN